MEYGRSIILDILDDCRLINNALCVAMGLGVFINDVYVPIQSVEDYLNE